MTSSYHEISNSSSNPVNVEESGGDDLEMSAKRLLNRARNWVGDLSMDGGLVGQEGAQVTYVAQDLNERIKRRDHGIKIMSQIVTHNGFNYIDLYCRWFHEFINGRRSTINV